MDTSNMVFVFGSNEAGRHGAGAAKTAMHHHGARAGQGFGLAIDQKASFAIPTKDWRIETLPVDVIKQYVDRFIVFARWHPGAQFQITALGCGLAGLRADIIAPMFKYAPKNCLFDEAWKPFLSGKEFWGTYP